MEQLLYLHRSLRKKRPNTKKQKARKRFRARAGIEPVISHIKYDPQNVKKLFERCYW